MTQNLVQNMSHRSTMKLHRSTMALEFFWIVGSGKIAVRWNYIVVRWYADTEKQNPIFGPDLLKFYEGYFYYKYRLCRTLGARLYGEQGISS